MNLLSNRVSAPHEPVPAPRFHGRGCRSGLAAALCSSNLPRWKEQPHLGLIPVPPWGYSEGRAPEMQVLFPLAQLKLSSSPGHTSLLFHPSPASLIPSEVFPQRIPSPRVLASGSVAPQLRQSIMKHPQKCNFKKVKSK